MKKLLALLLALVMVLGVLAGCNKTPADTTPDSTPAANNDPKPDEGNKDPEPTKTLAEIWAEAKDVTEIPDWEGDTLTMTCWWQAYSPNGGGFTMKESKENIYINEVRRITGCEFNPETSFFNNEKTPDEMIAQMVATNDFPDIMDTSDQNIRLLGENGYMWDVSEYMPKYAPTFWHLNGPDNPYLAAQYQAQLDKYGAIYSFCKDVSANFYGIAQNWPDAYPEITAFFTEERILGNKLGAAAQPERHFVYVRQDILNQLFPGCHTNESWRALLDEQGYLTEEQLCDIPIDSLADFEKMLYDIKAILDAAGDPTVYTFYTHNGTDNWSFFIQHKEIWGTQSDYLGYYDIEAGTLVKTLETDWYKDIVAMANKWLREGVASPEAVVDTHEQCKEKIANDKYAVVQRDFGPEYAGHPNPDSYRKVFTRYNVSDVTKDNLTLTKRLYPTEMINCMGIFKTGNIDTEEKLAQFLMSLEFLTTHAGQLLITYGTPDLGNYVVKEDGTVEAAGEMKGLIMAGNTQALSEYKAEKGINGASGYIGGGWPGYLTTCSWDLGLDNYKFAPVSFEAATNVYSVFPAEHKDLGITANIGVHAMLTGYFLNDVEGFKEFWNARTQWEGMMTKAMVAKTEAEFETAYQDMLDFIEECGWDDETMAEMNKMLLETQGLAEQLKAAGLPVPEGY